MTTAVRVLGADSAGRHGWVAVLVDEGGFVAACAGALAELIAWAEPVSVVGVDIPVGTSSGARRADVDVRRRLGPRASSLFAAPPSDVLDASDYAQANALLSARGAPKLSRQAWGLVPKMIEAAALAGDDRLVEVHPELSFREMAGEPLSWSKKSWNGLQLRRQLLVDAGIVVPDVIENIGAVGSDDVVDAAAAAWSARRVATGEALSFPDPPEEIGGRRVAIWC